MASKPSTSNPVKIEMSLKAMDARPKGKINEFKYLDQNLKTVLIKSKSRVTLTLVSLMNWAILRIPSVLGNEEILCLPRLSNPQMP